MFDRKVLSEPQIRRLAAGFVLLLFIFEIYVVRVNYSNYFVYLLDSETYFFSIIACCCILVSFYVFYRFISFALLASWPFRALCIVCFGISVTVEYGYQKALGRFSDKIDIGTAIAATPEQQIASISMYVSPAALIPCLLLLVLLVAVKTETLRGLKGLLVTFLLIAVSFLSFPFLVDQKFPTIATNAFFRTALDFLTHGPFTNGEWGSALTGKSIRRREVIKPAISENSRPLNNVVVVLDESVMGDHLSLNGYGRKTTPFLDKLADQNILHNWGIASAASTGSRFTYSSVITGLTPDDFPERTEFRASTFPTVFQYAKAMNYRTYFFDGQMNSYWGGVEDDKNYIDSWQGVLDISDRMAFETWDLDNKIARKVREILYSSTGNFVFIFKHGCHIPYQGNFPPEEEVWSPSYETANRFDIPSGDQLREVVNAYDNSIKYNLNQFFQNLVDDYTRIPNNSVIIYTGDHGQTLFVNGRSSHGGNTKAEANVPLFIVGQLDRKVDTGYKASHANLFPTILDLIGYPAELREKRGFPSLLSAVSTDSRQRYFNPDLGPKIPFD